MKVTKKMHSVNVTPAHIKEAKRISKKLEACIVQRNLAAHALGRASLLVARIANEIAMLREEAGF